MLVKYKINIERAHKEGFINPNQIFWEDADSEYIPREQDKILDIATGRQYIVRFVRHEMLNNRIVSVLAYLE